MFSTPLNSARQSRGASPSGSRRSRTVVCVSSPNPKGHTGLSSSRSQTCNSGPTAAQISKSLSAVHKESKRRCPRAQAEPFHNENGHSEAPPGLLSNIDHEIKVVLQTCPEADGPNGYLSMLRGAIVRRSIANMNIESGAFEGLFDADIRVLCRVIEELVRTGEARVGGETIRPNSDLRRKYLEDNFRQ